MGRMLSFAFPFLAAGALSGGGRTTQCTANRGHETNETGAFMNILDMLRKLRDQQGKVVTRGLPDEVIERFAAKHPLLRQAVEEAVEAHAQLQKAFPEILAMDEWDQVHALQQDFVNFYQDDVVNPYVPLAAAGPWIVTLKGAVIHDNGGYGMLGHGHAPQAVLDAMNQPHVMANIMTASSGQLRVAKALRRDIGQRRTQEPYAKFLGMNSGSEAVTVACRISDVNAKL